MGVVDCFVNVIIILPPRHGAAFPDKNDLYELREESVRIFHAAN
jgi:hypothetical protein